MLTAAALIASASATHERLGGPGTWLLALPAHHVAGLQVVVRSIIAGTVPVAIEPELRGRRTAGCRRRDGLADGGTRPWWRSSWPRRCGDPDATAALAELDAVLIGGGPMPVAVRESGRGGRHFGGAHLRHERDRGRLRVRRRGTATASGCASTTTAGWCSAAPPSPRATGTRSIPTRSPSPAGFAPMTLAPLMIRVCCESSGRIDDAIGTGGLTVMPHAGRGGAGHPSRHRRQRGVRRHRRAARPAGRRRGGVDRRRDRTDAPPSCARTSPRPWTPPRPRARSTSSTSCPAAASASSTDGS